MANHSAPNPTPPDDGKGKPLPAPSLIPVKSIKFLPGMNLDVPGLPQPTNGASAKDPCMQAFTRIGFDPRSQRYRVMWFAPGPDVNRAPAKTASYPAAICIESDAQ